MAMGGGGHRLYGENCSQGIGDVGEGDEFSARIQEPFVVLQDTWPRSSTGSDAQLGVFFFAEHLPGDDVGVMLEMGDDDLIVFLDVLFAPALGDEIDRFGGAADEDYFVRGGGV